MAMVVGAMAWMTQELYPWKLDRAVLIPIAGTGLGQTLPGCINAAECATNEDESGIKETKIYGHYIDPNNALEISVATRADDAEVDTSMWAYGGSGQGLEVAQERIRKFLHRCWLRGLCKEALSILRTMMGTERDHKLTKEGARDCLTRAANSNWWEWNDGSC
jgi:hypothetical protein